VVKGLGDALSSGAATAAQTARNTLTAVGSGLDTISTAQTVVGSRLSWSDLTTEHRTNVGELRADEQEQIGQTDIPTAMARLTQMTTVLEASQASFTKLAGLSLFEMLR
jgi:flagellar hook-associated protein 3 FlgL